MYARPERVLKAHGDRIVSSIFGGKPFEPESLDAWERLCEPGATVLDVGAYTGLYSIVAAKRGCRVIAFEPLFANVARCRENLEDNRVEHRVELRQEAVADKVGSVRFKYNGSVMGLTSGGSLIEPSGTGSGAKVVEIRVRCVTIDSLRLEECAAIKIDVERAEPLVLAGARLTLRRLRPALIVEVLGRHEKEAIKAAVPGYRVAATLDRRNWLMVAR